MVQPNNRVPFATKSRVRHLAAVVGLAVRPVVQVHLVEVVDQVGQVDPSYQVRAAEEEAAFRVQRA